MLLTEEQVRLLLSRLTWEPLYEDRDLVLAKKRQGGYSNDVGIARLEGRLSIMLEAAVRLDETRRRLQQETEAKRKAERRQAT